MEVGGGGCRGFGTYVGRNPLESPERRSDEKNGWWGVTGVSLVSFPFLSFPPPLLSFSWEPVRGGESHWV